MLIAVWCYILYNIAIKMRPALRNLKKTDKKCLLLPRIVSTRVISSFVDPVAMVINATTSCLYTALYITANSRQLYIQENYIV